ncbi:Acyl carrier protein phosphodiesterase [Filimonas lacunae]|uniref:Acyl carrier protein phosphodiesterase n=1 Tax=Filimonas lacunae TaxID=477680 RepID=A0A173MQW8_9BACT|nr:ACP phosphodiesterase [Filimonas lacunae]BAV09840.1 acyl carrier protein phosphodiesterase [Filimonas lacunae]SIS79756.1 Acyl carrier protein phosphodiesterase [Filimonas lacunae]
MNYLAHAHLSFNEPDILLGNMISDFVKGKQKFTYSEEIQKGIVLHRAIDQFTDEHAVTAEAKKVFKPAIGLYAGAFIDVVYDHFLALDTTERTEGEWKQFSSDTYAVLQQYTYVPERFARMLTYMSSQDWLFNYRYRWGIQNTFKGLSYRATYLNDESATAAYTAFEHNYEHLQACYQQFFPLLKAFAWEQYLYLCKK